MDKNTVKAGDEVSIKSPMMARKTPRNEETTAASCGLCLNGTATKMDQLPRDSPSRR